VYKEQRNFQIRNVEYLVFKVVCSKSVAFKTTDGKLVRNLRVVLNKAFVVDAAIHSSHRFTQIIDFSISSTM
jgi:hypothetical protein